MIPLKPSAILDLEHRAFLLESSSNQPLLVAMSQEDGVTVIGPNFTIQAEFNRPRIVQAVSIHPSRPLIAWIDGARGQVSITDTSGAMHFEIQAPKQAFGFSACFFDGSGGYLWCAASVSDTEVQIQLLDCETWIVVHTVIVKDPFGGSAASIHSTPDSDTVALWLAAQQDGQQVYWLNQGPYGIATTLEPDLTNTIPPVFSPSGHEFLVIGVNDMVMGKYQFPEVEFLASVEWPSTSQSEDQDESFGDFLCYIDEGRALVSACQGRLFLWDVNKMVIADEVIVEGHGPKPAFEIYPSLKGDNQLCTDFSWFKHCGDFIVAVYRRDSGVGLRGWQDSLVWLPIAALRAGIET